MTCHCLVSATYAPSLDCHSPVAWSAGRPMLLPSPPTRSRPTEAERGRGTNRPCCPAAPASPTPAPPPASHPPSPHPPPPPPHQLRQHPRPVAPAPPPGPGLAHLLPGVDTGESSAIRGHPRNSLPGIWARPTASLTLAPTVMGHTSHRVTHHGAPWYLVAMVHHLSGVTWCNQLTFGGIVCITKWFIISHKGSMEIKRSLCE